MSAIDPPLLDRFYEWLLSDAPAAHLERTRRRDHNRRLTRRDRALVQAWCRRTLDDPRVSAQLRGLAEVMERLVRRQAAREEAAEAEADEAWLRRARAALEAARRAAGDVDYRYPDRYLGAGAALQPVPNEALTATGKPLQLDDPRHAPDASQPPLAAARHDAVLDIGLDR